MKDKTDPKIASLRPTDSGSLAPWLVSFSGIDGAGKTTQIENLAAWLSDFGLQVCVIRFWEDVAALRRLRGSVGHALFKGEKGVGAPGKPVRRMDKNVRSWYMLPVRVVLCLLDTLALALVTAQLKLRSDVDVIIFDRYLYDQLANLDVSNRFIQAYIRVLLRLLPPPCVAYLLDADATLAQARKPEYPLEFVIANRANYLVVSKIAGMTVIPASTPDDVRNAIRHELAGRLAPQNLAVPRVLTST